MRSGKCELQTLAQDLGVREKRYEGQRRTHPVDASSVSLVRDAEKCILCGRCVRVCEEVQGVAAIDFTRSRLPDRHHPGFRYCTGRHRLRELRAVHPGLPHRRLARAEQFERSLGCHQRPG